MTAMNGVHNPSSSDIELIFLGTGTSGSVPNISCLTAPPDAVPCKTCLSTLTPEGKKNIRRNTSVVLRIPGHDGQKRTILIDVGKNFQAAALEWFPKYGLRRIDAVLITHAHADAMNGLDDLRAWTLRGVIQDHIPIYASRTTFAEVQRAFPYMVAKEHASGGGDVPEFKWHIFEDGMPITLEESGIEVMPLPVHHGRYFTPGPPKGFLPTPDTTHPPSRQSPTRELESKHLSPTHAFHPYICHAFLIQHSVLYMGDVSSVPDETWSAFTRYRSTSPSGERPLPVAVLDCLRPAPHTSHFGLREAVNAARKIGSARTYLTGFGHEIGHDEYTRVGEVLGGADINVKDLTAGEHKCLDAVEEGVNLWLRPAHDGLRVFIDGEQGIRDETYDAHE